MNTTRTFTNRIPKHADFDYETFTEEGEYVYGLVNIKDKDIPNYMEEGTRPGYQLTFRAKTNPNVFLNHQFAASVNARSNMFKCLKLMTGNKLKKEATPEEGFEALSSCLGKWFDIQIVVKNSTKYPGEKVNYVDDNQIRLSKDQSLGDAKAYFDSIATKKEENHPGFADDDLPDFAMTAEELAKKAKNTKKLDDILSEVDL